MMAKKKHDWPQVWKSIVSITDSCSHQKKHPFDVPISSI